LQVLRLAAVNKAAENNQDQCQDEGKPQHQSEANTLNESFETIHLISLSSGLIMR